MPMIQVKQTPIPEASTPSVQHKAMPEATPKDVSVIASQVSPPAQSSPSAFLAVAKAIVESLEQSNSARMAPLALQLRPPVVSQPLDERALDLYVNLLKMRGIKIHAFSKLSAVRDCEGSIIIGAESGAINFKGPLSSLPMQKKFDWSGIAVTIELTVYGDIIFRNPKGVYGNVKDRASTRILLTTEDSGEMAVRSLDKDPLTDTYLPLYGEKYISNGPTSKLCSSPCEMKIGLDSFSGVRQIETFSQPSCVMLDNVFYSEVAQLQHTPTNGTTRIELRHPESGMWQVRYIKT